MAKYELIEPTSTTTRGSTGYNKADDCKTCRFDLREDTVDYTTRCVKGHVEVTQARVHEFCVEAGKYCYKWTTVTETTIKTPDPCRDTPEEPYKPLHGEKANAAWNVAWDLYLEQEEKEKKEKKKDK